VGRLLDAPPKALPLRLDELGTLRLPTRSLPPVLRFAPTPLVPAEAPDRFAPVVPARLAPDACRDATESPRVEPPNLFAVARSP